MKEENGLCNLKELKKGKKSYPSWGKKVKEKSSFFLISPVIIWWRRIFLQKSSLFSCFISFRPFPSKYKKKEMKEERKKKRKKERKKENSNFEFSFSSLL